MRISGWALGMALAALIITASPVMGRDANRINVNLGFFEGEGGRLVRPVIIIRYS